MQNGQFAIKMLQCVTVFVNSRNPNIHNLSQKPWRHKLQTFNCSLTLHFHKAGVVCELNTSKLSKHFFSPFTSQFFNVYSSYKLATFFAHQTKAKQNLMYDTYVFI